jgi:hypothetical protein
MEGTSGAAERAPLRGGTRDAALSRRVRESGNPGRRRSLRRSTSGSFVCDVPKGRPRRRPLQPALVTNSDMRCPSRSGWGEALHRERSRWEVPNRGKLTLVRPLARDISAGHAPQGALPPAAQGRDRKVTVTRVAATMGDRGRGHAGCRRSGLCSRVVSIAEVDRRRVAPSRPATKSHRITRAGLAPLRESAGRVKERRKPDRRWQNREIGGGPPPNQNRCESGILGGTCRGNALLAGKVVLFDEGRRKRFWCLASVVR